MSRLGAPGATGEVRTLVVDGPGRARIERTPPLPVPVGSARVDTVYSGISAGTDLSFFRGTNPSLHRVFDPELMVFAPGGAPDPYPVRRFGYMQVGRVVETRSERLAHGGLVAMTYGHTTSHVADPARERVVELPADIDPLLGIYACHMGPICANGILHAAAEFGAAAVGGELGDGVRGRTVLVVGAGVVGVLTGLFAQWSGAAEVVVADADPDRLAVAAGLGLGVVCTEADADADADLGLWAKRHWGSGPGADLVFQCRGQSAALAAALRALRPQGVVIDLAFYQGGAGAVRLGEEFHHNGLTIRAAQIGRVPRGFAPGWTRDRLSAATIELLRAHGAALREHLVRDLVAFDEGPQLLADLSEGRRPVRQAVLVGDAPPG